MLSSLLFFFSFLVFHYLSVAVFPSVWRPDDRGRRVSHGGVDVEETGALCDFFQTKNTAKTVKPLLFFFFLSFHRFFCFH